jgi:hypothetical protein
MIDCGSAFRARSSVDVIALENRRSNSGDEIIGVTANDNAQRAQWQHWFLAV